MFHAFCLHTLGSFEVVPRGLSVRPVESLREGGRVLLLGGSAPSVGLPWAPFRWFRAVCRPALWRVSKGGRVLLLGGSAPSVGLPCALFPESRKTDGSALVDNARDRVGTSAWLVR